MKIMYWCFGKMRNAVHNRKYWIYLWLFSNKTAQSSILCSFFLQRYSTIPCRDSQVPSEAETMHFVTVLHPSHGELQFWAPRVLLIAINRGIHRETTIWIWIWLPWQVDPALGNRGSEKPPRYCRAKMNQINTYFDIHNLFNTQNKGDIDGLVQERRNSIASALELRLSYTNPSIWDYSVNCHVPIKLFKMMLSSVSSLSICTINSVCKVALVQNHLQLVVA